MHQNVKSNFRSTIKALAEFCYWKFKKIKESNLSNNHYKYFYTTNFNLEDSFYQNKAILDIGCGPRGSLEWADMAKERIGIDPLVNKYRNLGIDSHKMTYIQGFSEDIPFEDNYFDVVCSFNSIDHVEDFEKTINEIKRVLKKGGLFLLMVDIHKNPTITEPQTLKWDFVNFFVPEFTILDEKHLLQKKKRSLYANVRNNISSNDDFKNVDGVLVVKLLKN